MPRGKVAGGEAWSTVAVEKVCRGNRQGRILVAASGQDRLFGLSLWQGGETPVAALGEEALAVAAEASLATAADGKLAAGGDITGLG